MKIGIPKEIKIKENRVALTPGQVAHLIRDGHEVVLETGAGSGSGFADSEYGAAGARIGVAEEAWNAELVLKVKEPVEAEYRYLRNQIVFTFFHLAGVSRALTETLLERGTTAVAYETLEDSDGRLPILAPMSAIAGNMATLAGAYYLAKFNGGKGIQLGTVLGERHGKVLIVGDGVVAYHAASSARGLGAYVFVAGLDPEKGAKMRREIGDLTFFQSEPEVLAREIRDADLLIGAVLRHGARAEYVVTEAMVASMQPGSVIVDVSIDQGGCVATSRPTTHDDPVYEKHGVIHYCVANMPGAYPRTSTLALTRATFEYVRLLAAEGPRILRESKVFAKAVNTCRGYLTYKPVAEAFGLMDRYRDLNSM